MTIRRIDLGSLEAQRAWDARAVDAPGGDVHQGSAWLTYRASLGREAIARERDVRILEDVGHAAGAVVVLLQLTRHAMRVRRVVSQADLWRRRAVARSGGLRC